MNEVFLLSRIAVIIAKIACGAVAVGALLFIGWMAIQDYNERFFR